MLFWMQGLQDDPHPSPSDQPAAQLPSKQPSKQAVAFSPLARFASPASLAQWLYYTVALHTFVRCMNLGPRGGALHCLGSVIACHGRGRAARPLALYVVDFADRRQRKYGCVFAFLASMYLLD
jgi:hypothetical protein